MTESPLLKSCSLRSSTFYEVAAEMTARHGSKIGLASSDLLI